MNIFIQLILILIGITVILVFFWIFLVTFKQPGSAKLSASITRVKVAIYGLVY
jgi:hypothetical protein